MKKVVHKVRMDEQKSDFAYWQTQPYHVRLAALEQIRREYHGPKYDSERGIQRVCTIRRQHLADPDKAEP
jgi:hypothetical protein